MIASLSMYARPETQPAWATLWSDIRGNLLSVDIDAPEHLDQAAEVMSVWTNPNLVLSQTCGMPYRLFLKDKVSLIGTPDFGVEGCQAGYYHSAFVVRADNPRQGLQDFQDATFAFNEEHSQSGYAAPLVHAAQQGFTFDHKVPSGGHAVSAEMVATHKADIAALDAVTWRLVQRYDSFAQNIRVLTWTKPATPALPLISASGANQPLMFKAVTDAISGQTDEVKDITGLRGLVEIPKATYLQVKNP